MSCCEPRSHAVRIVIIEIPGYSSLRDSPAVTATIGNASTIGWSCIDRLFIRIVTRDPHTNEPDTSVRRKRDVVTRLRGDVESTVVLVRPAIFGHAIIHGS